MGGLRRHCLGSVPSVHEYRIFWFRAKTWDHHLSTGEGSLVLLGKEWYWYPRSLPVGVRNSGGGNPKWDWKIRMRSKLGSLRMEGLGVEDGI
jgi:hypothetical protein